MPRYDHSTALDSDSGARSCSLTVGLVVPLLCMLLWPGSCMAGSAGLGTAIERILADENLTGIGWSLVSADDGMRIGAAGLRDNAAGLAFTPDTRFHVGSLTKTVLATGVLRLVSTGQIELDAPVTGYLTGLFPDRAPPGFREVTVRHLLDHTAGLDDARLWQMFSERPRPDDRLVAAFPEPAAQLRVRARPGSIFSYSNMGYALLGMVIESITGSRYETYLDQHLLRPLGMHESTFAFTTQEGEAADPTLAWGHLDDGSPYPASPLFLRPAGQFTTSAADLATLAAFLMSDGRVDGHPFIDEALMRARGRPFGTEAADAGLVAGYGLGLARRDRHGVVGYCHGGNIVGFVARLCLFPEERKAFAYSVNTDSETADYGRIDALLVAALGIARATSPATDHHPVDLSGWLGHYVLSPNRFQMFEYLDTVFGSVKIASADGAITLESWQRDPRLLRPVNAHLYSANDRTTASHVVLRDDQGAYLLSDGFQTYRRVSPLYLAAHWVSVALGLAGLAWILVAGIVSLARYRSATLARAEGPAFLAAATLLLPIPLFAAQSFIALGDLTLASAVLASATFLLPLGMIATLARCWREPHASKATLAHGVAALCVLQWCAVLVAADMLPLRLWA